MAGHVQPIRLDSEALVVSVDHPAWATQVRRLGDELLDRVAEETGARPAGPPGGPGPPVVAAVPGADHRSGKAPLGATLEHWNRVTAVVDRRRLNAPETTSLRRFPFSQSMLERARLWR